VAAFDKRFEKLVEFSAKLTGLEKVHATIQALSAGVKMQVRAPTQAPEC
jgi:hypothetical protein